MKHTFHSLLFLLILCAAEMSAKDTNDSILNRLDGVLKQRQYYILQKEDEIAHKKELYDVASGAKKYDICREIYELYNGFNTDSAIHYSQQCELIALRLGDNEKWQQSQIFKANCLSINCLYENALSIMEPLEAVVTESNKNQFYRAYSSLRFWEGQFSTIPGAREESWGKIGDLRRKTIESEQSYVWRRQEEALLICDAEPQAALTLLLPVLDSLPKDDDRIRFLSNSIGSFYGRMNMQDSALYYYAVSAISDMEHGIMEHASLREVALILYRKGDIERAYQYMNCCIEDALMCKARLRTIEMAGDMPLILEAYQSKIHGQQKRLKWNIIILFCAVALLIMLVVFAFTAVKRQRALKESVTQASEQLKLANDQLKESLLQLENSNQSLRDSNRIRSAYVTQYMKECSEAIEKLGVYHKRLLRVAMQSNYEKLLAAVKSTEFVDDNLRTFYLHFDETFLSLFPHFVEDFNRLLRPDEQFELPQSGKLSTELRIFALIRLGITDSEDIARFLRLSTKTVYNYRASVRNRALGDRDKLEEQVIQTSIVS